MKIGSVKNLEGNFAYLSVLWVTGSPIELVLNQEPSFFEHVRVAVFGEGVVEVGSCVFSSEIEHFGGVFVQKNAPVHLIESDLLFLDLLSSEAKLLFLLDEGEGMGGVDVGVLSGGNETVSAVLFVLLLFQVDAAHHFAETAEVGLE